MAQLVIVTTTFVLPAAAFGLAAESPNPTERFNPSTHDTGLQSTANELHWKWSKEIHQDFWPTVRVVEYVDQLGYYDIAAIDATDARTPLQRDLERFNALTKQSSVHIDADNIAPFVQFFAEAWLGTRGVVFIPNENLARTIDTIDFSEVEQYGYLDHWPRELTVHVGRRVKGTWTAWFFAWQGQSQATRYVVHVDISGAINLDRVPVD